MKAKASAATIDPADDESSSKLCSAGREPLTTWWPGLFGRGRADQIAVSDAFLLVRVRPERGQDLADRAASEEHEEHVLSPRLAHPESMGGPESVLGSRRERQQPLRARTGSDAKPLPNHVTDRLDGQPEVRPDSANDVVLSREQPEKQMLDLDCTMPHVAGLVLRTQDRLARVFCERLEHAVRVLVCVADP
jgi:hypothetical protein